MFMACSEQVKKNEQPPDAASTAPVVEKDTFPVSKIIPVVECKKNPSLSYALYLPHQYVDSARLPVLILTDPHGDGLFPVSKYYSLAEKFGVILDDDDD